MLIDGNVLGRFCFFLFTPFCLEPPNLE